MAVHVKSIDPNHLVEIGLEGFYGPSTPNKVQYNPNTHAQQVGTDFIRNHQVLGVDFASVHIYADSWWGPIWERETSTPHPHSLQENVGTHFTCIKMMSVCFWRGKEQNELFLVFSNIKKKISQNLTFEFRLVRLLHTNEKLQTLPFDSQLFFAYGTMVTLRVFANTP